MKPKLSLLLLLLSPFFSFAQQKDDAFTIKQFTIDAGFTGVQLGSELATGKVTSVQFRGGVLPLLYHPQDEFTEEMKWVAGLSFSAEYRFYYNFEKRLEKGKEVTNNGANYISLFALYGTKPLGKNKNLPEATGIVVAGPLWGFNRPLGERALIHVSLGPALQHEIHNERSTGTLYGDVRFCFRLN